MLLPASTISPCGHRPPSIWRNMHDRPHAQLTSPYARGRLGEQKCISSHKTPRFGRGLAPVLSTSCFAFIHLSTLRCWMHPAIDYSTAARVAGCSTTVIDSRLPMPCVRSPVFSSSPVSSYVPCREPRAATREERRTSAFLSTTFPGRAPRQRSLLILTETYCVVRPGRAKNSRSAHRALPGTYLRSH